MQHNIYSRQLISILALSILVVFSGASCLSTMQAAGPGSHMLCSRSDRASSGRSEVEGGSSSEEEAVYFYKQQPSNGIYQVYKNHYKGMLCHVLGYSIAFTEQSKQGIIKCISQLAPDAIAALEGARISLIEVLEGISAQLAMDERQGKWSEPVEDASNGRGECVICLSDLGDSFMVLPCHPTHAFHSDCIQAWFYREVPPPAGLCRWCLKYFYRIRKPTCPVCRKGFSPSSLGLLRE